MSRDGKLVFKNMIGSLSMEEVSRSKEEAILNYKQKVIDEHNISITNLNKVLREI